MKKKVIFISSEGGHLNELQQLEFESYEYLVVTEKTETSKNLNKKYKDRIEYLVYETRKKPFKYFFVFLINILKSIRIFWKFKPDVIVSTGTHTAVPICYIAKIHRKKVIWIETFANSKTKTLSGRLVYPIADKFIVQWKSMLKVYPKAEYWGSIY